VVVTLGGDGLLVADAAGVVRLSARPTTVRDTTGAGDTFNGVLAAHLAGGDGLAGAVQAANAAAALSVAAVGARTGMPYAAEIASLLVRS
jgi:ribokinase